MKLLRVGNKGEEIPVILDNDNKFTRHTCTNDIIKKIEIEMFEVGANVHQLCDKYLVQDLGNQVNQYLDNYIEI